MRTMVRVSVHSIDGSIAQSFVERLLMFDTTLCLSQQDAESVTLRYAPLLEAGLSEVVVSNDADVDFTFFAKQNIVTINQSCSMMLHDVLTSGHNEGLVNPELDLIWDAIDGTIDAEASHYWVAESDVVDAMVRIALHQPELPSRIDVAGRRCWSTRQTHHELKMLYDRTQAGSTGEFTASHLDQPPSPKISVVPIDGKEQASRPELGPLHETLVQCDGHGWQPTSTLRTAMMVYLAGKLND